ncbi:MAG: dTDP-glucose 4,6-dehydratase, partial [Candidatus Hodarchaeales archaeon]
MKLVVITGCLGLIGAHVTRNCLLKGWKVYGIDKCTYAANLDFLEEFQMFKNFTFVKEDIAKIKSIPDCDYVINIAAESHVGNSIIDSNDFIHSNIVGVKNILDIIRRKPRNVDDQPIFFHFSTDEVYGDITEGQHIEKDILMPSNPYSASKAAADMLILAWARTYDMKYIILRPTNNYGIGQYPEKLIPICVKHLMRDKKIRLHDAGEPIRNWLHSDDTANAVIKIIESGKTNEIYNVAGGFEQKNKDTVKKIVQCFFGDDRNYQDYVDLEYKRMGQDVRYALNDDKLRQLGWEPK